MRRSWLPGGWGPSAPRDALVAAALLAAILGSGVGSLVVGTAAALLQSAPVAVRRRHPLPAAGVVATGFALAAAQPDPPESLASLAAYLVAAGMIAAALERRREAGVAWVLLTFGGAAQTSLAGDSDLAFIVVLVSIAVAGGWVVGDRGRRASRAEQHAQRAARIERERIARELHDGVAHAVSLMVVQSGAAEQVLSSDPQRAAAALRHVQTAGRESVADLQRVLGLLRSGDEDEAAGGRSLTRAEELVDGMRQAGLDLALDVRGGPRRLPGGVDQAAFRILQEALTNALRHGSRATATAEVTYGSDAVRIVVANPAPARPPGERGHGIIGMRERVAIFGGVLEAGMRDGEWVVSATLPVPAP